MWETSVNSCGPSEWETSVGDKCGRQVWETSVGDKWETSVNSCGPRHPEWETSVGDKWEDKWETSANSCCPRPKVGDKCKLMGPDKCGRQVWETSGRQV